MVFPVKDKKGVTITNAFQRLFDNPSCWLAKSEGHTANISGCKSHKIYVDKRCEIYKKSMKLWLQDNGRDIYSIQTEGKLFVVKIL